MSDPVDELQRKPRRRIVFIAKIESDDWPRLQAELRHLETEISRHGKLSPYSVSGGYSCGHIIVSSEDGSIDHDSWARELNAYLEDLAEREAKEKAAIESAAERPFSDDVMPEQSR